MVLGPLPFLRESRDPAVHLSLCLDPAGSTCGGSVYWNLNVPFPVGAGVGLPAHLSLLCPGCSPRSSWPEEGRGGRLLEETH